MFKSARWRGDKNKVKAVFKLQFHATQVSQFSADALTVSLIPADVGKPTAKTEKATVRDETCCWEKPVYQKVKFNREPRTGKIIGRIYYFLVSTGSSKPGTIGEISIDFADYAEATKPLSISLPLKNSDSNAVLHVLIQRLQADADQREVEQCEELNIKSEDQSLKTFLSNDDVDEIIASHPTEDGRTNKTAHNSELNGNHIASIGSDITLSGSESSSGLNTPRELGLRSNTMHQEQAANASMTVYEEWSGSSDHGISTDESIHSSHGALQRERSQQASDIEIEKLKAELVALARQADVSELELQTLRKQIVKESKRGQDLSREIVSLKEEKDALESECEKLKAFHKRMDETKFKNKLQSEGGDLRALVEELRQELIYEKDLNANLRLQLQKTQESNTELILAVRDLEEMLTTKNTEISDLYSKIGSSENAEYLRGTLLKCETDEDEEQKALEELVKEHGDAKETCLLEQKIIDLNGEIEIYRRDKDELEMQMEQLELDYEILKQENHDMSYKLEQSQLQEQLKIQYECSTPPDLTELEAHIDSLENELKRQSKELSGSLATMRELETHIKRLEEELEKQAQGFEGDLEAVMRAKVEQEQRAIQAEEASRKTKWKNASTAERLQDEFRKLSVQMFSTFDANEKVAAKALKEANELRWQKSQLEEMLQKVKEELQSMRDDYEARMHELSNQIDMKQYQIEQMLVEIDYKSKQLEHQKQHGEEVSRAFSKEIEVLKAEIKRLMTEHVSLSERAEQQEKCQAQLEQMRISIKESEMLVQRGNEERIELVSTIALLKKEAEKSLKELSSIRHLKDEKEATVGFLQLEMETLRSQCNNLKHSLFEDEFEKENLRNQILELENDVRKKVDALTSIEKKLKDSYGHLVSDGTKTTLKNQKSTPAPHGLEEVASLREKIKLLEIKLKETALKISTNSFLEKERDLQNKIEDLEGKMEELIQAIPFQKASKDTSNNVSNSGVPEEASTATDPLSITACLPGENENALSLTQSNYETSEKELIIKVSSISNKEGNLDDDLIAELASLKERNRSMETDLKEMQERYSEISLKFAEVEGERQKLVMKVRNLKHAKKI
ncbi:hypothetical protein I3842_11G136400 [Carya illinoinensis]|uniref:C2 NT-type domain-containing protein n=1 Tax=Carya illinoinensis TaxID=32201 RepID=A0A922DQW6_CARIL|nr:hypothetical protein I3842_11G136400 [Carya illinoinensis]